MHFWIESLPIMTDYPQSNSWLGWAWTDCTTPTISLTFEQLSLTGRLVWTRQPDLPIPRRDIKTSQEDLGINSQIFSKDSTDTEEVTYIIIIQKRSTQLFHNYRRRSRISKPSPQIEQRKSLPHPQSPIQEQMVKNLKLKADKPEESPGLFLEPSRS